MGAVYVFDDYYLAITLLITVCYQLFFFSIAFSLKFDKLTDFAGGTNFALLAILTLLFSGKHHARQIVVSIFMILWALRLSMFLLFRIIKTGKDDRFDDKRDKFFPFLGFWIFQMLWVWIVSLPVTVLNSPGISQFPQPTFGTGRDIAGVIIFIIGFSLESISDALKYKFRSKRSDSVLYATILGPIFLTILLMFVSGLTLAERPAARRRYEEDRNWEEYAHYLNRTSILIPFPPSLYAKLPVLLKRTLFLEFPIYVFDPEKHSNQGLS
ncbi:putative 3-oxo-5-alpha-steroid 4-dehydrogenase protein [Golovinomyces cichoracearum]|uniref:Putative 3-oxo-5-alpha-steroid 4-dehydrogenase protein n=1 Tax=Golovinomyces cichoracearum TaxID=62708 RepID=A0A420HAP9_9PEZI|nr:putative 3-oxo-5-alpha-steroid 4-dehydrogenase protein [Golovinomyces cichoracearum]